MDALGQELHAVGGARIEWRVLEWNEPSIRVYESIGAKFLDGGEDMKVEEIVAN